MVTKIINAKIVLPDEIVCGSLLIRDGVIASVCGGACDAECDELIDAEGGYLLAGFVDIHCHGGGGGSFGKPELEEHIMAMKMHLSHGVTSMTPTTATDKAEEMKAFAQIKKAIDALLRRGHSYGTIRRVLNELSFDSEDEIEDF